MMTGRSVLIVIEMLAVSVWVGSLVCLAIVAKVAREQLDERSRIALFRQIGRFYGVAGTGSLVIAIGAGVVLAWPLSQVGHIGMAAFVLAGVLVFVTGAGVLQARRMTVMRRRALENRDDKRAATTVRRGAAFAAALRGSIALLTLAILVLSASVLDQ
jgi:hypothetical protein